MTLNCSAWCSRWATALICVVLFVGKQKWWAHTVFFSFSTIFPPTKTNDTLRYTVLFVGWHRDKLARSSFDGNQSTRRRCRRRCLFTRALLSFFASSLLLFTFVFVHSFIHGLLVVLLLLAVRQKKTKQNKTLSKWINWNQTRPAVCRCHCVALDRGLRDAGVFSAASLLSLLLFSRLALLLYNSSSRRFISELIWISINQLHHTLWLRDGATMRKLFATFFMTLPDAERCVRVCHLPGTERES